MSSTDQSVSQDKVSDGADRPEGTVDEDANAPLTDMATADIDRTPDTIAPQDTGSAVPPYEGRQRSSDGKGTPGGGENA